MPANSFRPTFNNYRVLNGHQLDDHRWTNCCTSSNWSWRRRSTPTSSTWWSWPTMAWPPAALAPASSTSTSRTTSTTTTSSSSSTAAPSWPSSPSPAKRTRCRSSHGPGTTLRQSILIQSIRNVRELPTFLRAYPDMFDRLQLIFISRVPQSLWNWNGKGSFVAVPGVPAPAAHGGRQRVLARRDPRRVPLSQEPPRPGHPCRRHERSSAVPFLMSISIYRLVCIRVWNPPGKACGDVENWLGTSRFQLFFTFVRFIVIAFVREAIVWYKRSWLTGTHSFRNFIQYRH